MKRLFENKRKTKIGTLLHNWLRSRDTFTQLEEATGTLLHNWKKQSGHFYTTGRSNRETFTQLERHKTIHLGRFYTTNEKTSNKREIKT